MLKKLSIAHFPFQPHCFAYGGFDIQMNRVIDLLKETDVNTIRIDFWDKDSRFDVAHFWGATESHTPIIYFCKERNIKVVLSALFPPLSNFSTIIKFIKSNLLKLFNISRSYNLADCILVINDEQAIFANKILGINKNKIIVIPTMLDDIFFQSKSVKKECPTQLNNFCLIVGTICERKNQISLMHAAIRLNQTVVFVGRIDLKNSVYSLSFWKLLNENSHLFQHFESLTSDDLFVLYKRSSIVACISHQETEPASILEGMIFNKPILAGNKPYGRNSKFKGVIHVDPTDLDSITKGLEKASKIKNVKYSNFNSVNHRWNNVIESYLNIYKSLISSLNYDSTLR
jgi:glycosyltransferase involved in cell wall biosynthesis